LTWWATVLYGRSSAAASSFTVAARSCSRLRIVLRSGWPLHDAYSDACLRRIWGCEHFSWWMTTMLHLPPGADPFDVQLQRSQLRYLTTSRAQAAALTENYVGLATV
jgi:p-hydroxybenzoate 3-monooxygenase